MKMRIQYKSFLYITIFYCSFLGRQATAQATLATTDIDATYKLAKEYYARDQFSLAYPIFSDIHHHKIASSNYPETIAIEASYYYTVCGLKLNKWLHEQLATNFIEQSTHAARVQMMCFELAEFYFRQKKYAEALAFYDKTGIQNLNNTAIASLKFHKAYCLFTMQQFKEAKPLFNAIRQIADDANYIDANYYYGFIAFYDKQYKDALAAFTVAENDATYSSIVPFYIAEIHYFNNDRDIALSYAEKQIKKGGQFYDLQLKQLAGQLYFDKRQFAKAQPYLEEYINKTEKVSRENLYELSYCYYEAGVWKKSIEGFKQLGGKEDSLAQNSMYLLADAYLKTDQKMNARNAFLFCASNNSNATQKEISTFSYAKLSYELGYTDVALRELQQFIIQFPKSNQLQEAKELLVVVLANTSNYKDALALFESLKNKSETAQKIYPKILYGRAVELINDQQITQADALLSQITQLPYNATYMPFVNFWKGEIAYRTGSVDNAIVYLQAYLNNAIVNGEVNTVHAKYNLAYCFLKKEDYKQAQKYFEQIGNVPSISATSIQQDAYIRSADCYFMNKQFKQALKMYEEVIALQLKNADYALYQKAIIAGASNKNADKIKYMQQLIQQFPSSTLLADANIEIANSFLSNEQFNEALPPLQQVLNNKQAKALWPQAYLKTGVAHFNLNNNTDALTNFTTLVKQYPNATESEDAIEYIRNIFVENQQPANFVTFMQQNGKSITTNEADSLTYKSAMIKYEAKVFDEAKQGFESYLSQFATGRFALEAHYFLAEICINQKDFNAALPHYNVVASKAPNKYAERSCLQSARIYYFDLKDFENAQKYFAQLKNIAVQQENRLEAMRGLLRCQYKLQQFKDAVTNAQDLLAEKGTATDDKMIANMIVAKSYQSANQLEQATSAYKAVIALGKTEYAAEAQYRLAEILLIQQKFAEAENAAFDVIKKVGSYEMWVTKSYILLGDIYFKQKDLFNAEATYKSVAENTTIEELIQEANQKLGLVIAEKNKTNKVVTP